jgi:hypothetical protein
MLKSCLNWTNFYDFNKEYFSDTLLKSQTLSLVSTFQELPIWEDYRSRYCRLQKDVAIIQREI